MPAAPLPADEDLRLARLRALGVLDTPPEPLFDALARLAASIAGTPIALVSLVDAERQWFKANVGLPGAGETPRALAFCAHAILGADLLEVPDARADARFADNPAVHGDAGLRFYAGAPLVMAGGERIGTLCVADRVPRHLSDAQRAQLGVLAEAVVRSLEERERLQALAQAKRRRLEAELTGDLRSRNDILDLLPTAVSAWDGELRCVYANTTVARSFGRERAAMPGLPLAEMIGAEAMQRSRADHAAALGGTPLTFESRIRTVRGLREHRIRLVPRRLADGRVDGFIALADDITDERAARAADAKFRALSEASPVGVFHTDAEGRCTYTNERWQQIYGLTFEQSLGDGWTRTLHPDDRDAVVGEWRRRAAAGEEFQMAFRIRRPDGSVRHVRARSRELRGADGRIDGHVGAVADITDAMTAQIRLRESEALLERTGRVAGVGGWQLDLATMRVEWTAETCRLHDLPPGHQPGIDDALRYYAPEGRPLIDAAVQRGLQDGTPWDLELPFITAAGRRLWVRAVGEAERDASGRIVRLVGAFLDVTRRRVAEQRLIEEQALRLQVQQQAADLDALLTERSDMLNVLAHEVRQPLNNASAALQSAAALLADQGAADAAARLARAQNLLGHVLAGVDNTLAVAALLASPLPATHVDADIDTLLAVVIGDLPADERARVRIERASAARTASMDPALLRLALRNLVANALKFAPHETPVRVCIADVEEPPALLIDVIDTGPGIDAAVRPRLFQRGAATRRADGSPNHGLGLFIARRALEMQSGDVQLVASDARGTRLRIVLPQGLDDYALTSGALKM
jgi:PAS domain S-box-containing protein